jgi:hydroxymethylglutaryl-CoA lyase
MDVLVSEVGPRDGLQGITTIMPLEAKKAWVAAEAAAGVREIEVGSFVPARLLPQLADTADLVAFARTIPGLTVAVLVPNARGAEAAIAAGAHKITLPLSVSETHSLANLRRNHVQVIAEARSIAAMIAALPVERRPHFEGSLSTVFGCTLEGMIPDAQVGWLAGALVEAGCDEVGLSDTTGFADPAAVRRLIGLVHWHPPPQHPRPRTRQRAGGAGLRTDHLRCVAWRTRRLPVCAGGFGQHRDRGSGLHAGGDGHCYRHRS